MSLPRIEDLSKHPFTSFEATEVSHLFKFSAPLLGEGLMGFGAPISGTNLLYIRCKPESAFGLAYKEAKPNQVSLNYLLEAKKYFTAIAGENGNEESFSAGTVLVDATNFDYKWMKFEPDHTYEWVSIFLEKKVYEHYFDRFMEGYAEELKEKSHKIIYTDNRAGIQIPFDVRQEHVIRQMINCPFDGNFRTIFLELKMTELLLYYFHNLISANFNFLEENNTIVSDDKVQIIAIKNHIDEHIDRDFNIQELQDISRLSEYRIKYYFKQIYGISIGRYYRKKRLNHAFIQILNENESIKNLAHTCGYNSTQAFSRAFYQEFNVRPSEVRTGFTPVKDFNS
ncbi:helix-turn-helix domain-containing protein [Flavobacterium sp. JP2137]|uniref:helix-turn-helix domain-containing protein n=1 Tax=Flavobacterium sp. JP2137 TaxID=3414510 RepID=UPI003D2FE26F